MIKLAEKNFYPTRNNCFLMRKEITEALIELEIEGKEIRKKKACNIVVIVVFAIVFYLIPFFFSYLNVLLVIDILIAVIGGVYIIVEGIPTLCHPLDSNSYAFKKIARAIQILEKSNKLKAYEEAYRSVKHAHKTLRGIERAHTLELGWYDEVNQILDEFLENLQLIVLPAIANSIIKIEHLEEIALAILSGNPLKMKIVNERLRDEPSYKKTKLPPGKITVFARKILTFSKKESIKFSLSFILSSFFVTITILTYSKFFSIDLLVFISELNNFLQILTVAIALAVGIYSFWRRKT